MGLTNRKSKTDTTALLRRIQDRLSTRLKLERDRTANLSFVSSFICAADGRSLHGHHGHRYARRILPSAACDRKDEFAPDACCRRSDSRNRDRRCGHCFQDAPHRLQQAQALRQEPQSRTSTPQSAFRRQRGHETSCSDSPCAQAAAEIGQSPWRANDCDPESSHKHVSVAKHCESTPYSIGATRRGRYSRLNSTLDKPLFTRQTHDLARL